MKYLKLSITITPSEEWFRDVLSSQLGDIGFESFMETDAGLNAYIPEKDFNLSKLQSLLAEQPGDAQISWSKEVIEDKNWNEEWEKNYFQPLLIGEECVIRAPFHKEYPKAKFEIIIEPNMAFGTGNHETTSMMVEAILAEDLKEKAVLDMGCGTGILGILASMKGAKQITAIDISEWAVSGTNENAAFNKIENITVRQGDAMLLGNETYDLILANIHRNVLLEDMKTYSKNLKRGGKMFLSGFYLEELADIKNEAQKQALQYISHQIRKNWIVAVFQS